MGTYYEYKPSGLRQRLKDPDGNLLQLLQLR
jgi:hypothetical protein